MLEVISDYGVELAWLAIFSLASFVLTLLIVPWLLIQLPSDYFVSDKRKQVPWAQHHIVLRYLFLFIKNVFGYVIILAGIAMLILPGQGLLSIIIGLMLVDFPGKFSIERRLIKSGPLLTICNKIRKAANKPPFRFDDRSIFAEDQ